MTVHNALESEWEEIFLMGFDVWGGDLSQKDYLESCFQSEKYRKGTWKVLKDGDDLLSSLIVYELKDNIFGIGSISTPVKYRKKGLASTLIERVLLEMKPYSKAFYLYADIKPEFYEKLGFKVLDKKFQKYDESVCMKLEVQETDDFVPNYF